MRCCRNKLDSANDDYLIVMDNGEQYENDRDNAAAALYVTVILMHFNTFLLLYIHWTVIIQPLATICNKPCIYYLTKTLSVVTETR